MDKMNNLRQPVFMEKYTEHYSIGKPLPSSNLFFGQLENGKISDSEATPRQQLQQLQQQQQQHQQERKLQTEFIQFTQNTTFHGIRYIFSSGSVFRRLLWILAVLGCTGAVTWQCYDRLRYFLDWPIATSVQINYNDTLTFPTVTICNQNTFKSTEAAAVDRYRLIEKLYSGYDKETVMAALEKYGAVNMTYEELLFTATHRKEDMIVDCSWVGQTCGPDNFTSYITDYGVCFTFNGPTEFSPQDRLYLSSTGALHGLRLTLNVEQYEYMPGPNDGAGIKVYLHDLDIPPLVRDLGQAVSTGSHTFMGVTILKLENLKSPYGECAERPLKYFSQYSKTACRLECLAEYIDKECQCRLPHFPFGDDSPPVCTIVNFINCASDAHVAFPLVAHECECPVSCSYLLFDPQISQTSLSNFLIDKFQRSEWALDLAEKFIDAMEISHRYRDDLREETRQLVQITLSAFGELKRGLLGTTRSQLDLLLSHLNAEQSGMKRHYDMKDFIFGFQEYVLRKNFMRARDAIEERTMGHVTGNFLDFTAKLNHRIITIAQTNNSDIREAIYLLTNNIMQSKLRIVRMAKENYTELLNAFGNASQRFGYVYQNRSLEEGNAVVPKILVPAALKHAAEILQYGSTGDILEKMIDELEEYRRYTEQAYYNGTFQEGLLSNLTERFVITCKEYLLYKFHWHESVDWPLKQIQERRKLFNGLWKGFEDTIGNMRGNGLKLNASLTKIEGSVMHYFSNIISKAVLYTTGGNVSKVELSRIFNSAETHDGINSLKVFVASLRTRQQEIVDDWTRLKQSALHIWREILEDKDSQEYYWYKNLTEYQRDYDTVASLTRQKFEERSSATMHLFTQNADRVFYKKLYDIMDGLSAFEQGTKVSPAFFRENMLKLDIFFRDLSYEHIMQMTAYDEFSLICDIGGAFGLFVGASLLSLLEIFDFIFIHIHDLFGSSKTTMTTYS